MKKYVSLIAILFVACLSLTNCQKETTSGKKVSLTNEEIIKRARNWYEKNHEAHQSAGTRTIIADETPDWSSAIVLAAVADIQVTAVPSYVDNNTGVVKQQIIITDGTEYVNRIVVATPTTAYSSSTQFSNRFATFTGTMQFQNENGTPLGSLSYSGGRGNGSVITSLNRSDISTVAPRSIERIDLAEVEIIAPSLSNNYSPGTVVLVVAPSLVNSVTVSIPLYPTSWGSSSSGTTANVSVNNIRNQVQNPCTSGVINDLLNKGLKNKISKLINRIFGGNGNLDITFREKPATDFPSSVLGELDTQDTQFFGQRTDPTFGGEVYINLNRDSLAGKPKELLATVVLHECIHAYLAQRGNPRLLLQHDLMADSYRGDIAQALKELFPSISDTDAAALSWEGLTETYAWNLNQLRDIQALHPENIAYNQIITLLSYQNGIKGTKCN
ncbi:hypothetical protein [Chitinophaga tropicalis]|uniref:Uncharacterized protein n=1 Tax=Chitinophaga tropicalis TaxID=2683588 RepID=A0A7K1U8F5_9BACT|nr:hypothetical protein [Chitinophaga tropicalis]MVT10596.1 hypothetical protein [Chitinophaga tropicalis]